MANMGALTIFSAALLCVNGALAGANYPPIPEDKTTPVQQRLAYHGPNGQK